MGSALRPPPQDLGGRNRAPPRPRLTDILSPPFKASGSHQSRRRRSFTEIETQNRVLTELIRTEVENELREAARRDGPRSASGRTNAQADARTRGQAPELKAEVRASCEASWKPRCARPIVGPVTQDIIDQQVQQVQSGGSGSPADRRRPGARPGKSQAIDGPLRLADGRGPVHRGRRNRRGRSVRRWPTTRRSPRRPP